MILLTRHGQTDWNAQEKIMGRCDEPLNSKGINQANEVREKLLDAHIDLIICSPLKRAKQTAQVINEGKNIPIIFDERIIERDFGEFEGFKYNEIDSNEFWNYYKNDHYERAENIQDFFKRVYLFLDDICEKYHDKDVLIVAHGGVSVAVNCYFNNSIPQGSLTDANLVLKNCEVAKYDYKYPNITINKKHVALKPSLNP